MKLHLLIGASLLALASIGAQAATTLKFDHTVNGVNAMVSYGTGDDAFALMPTTGSFEHLWLLDVDSANNGFRISFENSTDPTNGILNITDLSVEGSAPITFTDANGDGSLWVYEGGSLATAVYNINVTGESSGFIGGSYTVTMAPVPLPPAALLFGSALIGMAAMRRKKAAKELVEA